MKVFKRWGEKKSCILEIKDENHLESVLGNQIFHTTALELLSSISAVIRHSSSGDDDGKIVE